MNTKTEMHLSILSREKIDHKQTNILSKFRRFFRISSVKNHAVINSMGLKFFFGILIKLLHFTIHNMFNFLISYLFTEYLFLIKSYGCTATTFQKALVYTATKLLVLRKMHTIEFYSEELPLHFRV